MLESLKTLRYAFEDGGIKSVEIGFEDWTGNPSGSLNLTLTPDDGDLDTMTPKQLQELAKEIVLDKLNGTQETEQPSK